MPLFLRIIAQRLSVYLLGFLAFLGINPDIQVPTLEEIQQTEQRQQERIAEVFEKNENLLPQEKVTEIEDRVEEIVKEITKNQQNTQQVIQEIVNVPNLENTEKGIKISDDFVENVIVNIVCVNRSRNLISMTTGSGVIISPSGLVLTNSHVANSLLFNDKERDSYKDCTIRRENIPSLGYRAELVYLPNDWLSENINFFSENNPRGSGENDYALLAITESITPAIKFPTTFQYANFETDQNSIKKGAEILVAAYPGVNSGVFEVDSNSRLKKAISYIEDLITFNRSTVDVISTGVNDVAKRGSSGGGIFSEDKLIGIISTTDEGDGGSYINAITLPYILRDFRQDTGQNLDSFIKYDKNYLISEFEKEEGLLKSIIADFL